MGQKMWSQAAYFKKFVLIQCFMVWGSIHSASYRKLLDDDDVKTINQVFEDSKEDLTNLIDSIFGEECLSDSGCAPLIAFCDRNEGFSGSLGKFLDSTEPLQLFDLKVLMVNAAQAYGFGSSSL